MKKQQSNLNTSINLSTASTASSPSVTFLDGNTGSSSATTGNYVIGSYNNPYNNPSITNTGWIDTGTYSTIDTESTSTQYTINAAAKGFAVGDRLKFGLYSYSKDWAGNKHFNGGGSGSAQVISSAVTMVSDKFIYLSENGGTFTKYKVYISVNGGSFTEIKKEKLKIIS